MIMEPLAFPRADGEEREAVCPTGAMTIKNETDKAWEILRGDKESTRVVVQIAPAVRVALGEKFGLARGEDAMGKIVAALKKIGAAFLSYNLKSPTSAGISRAVIFFINR